MFEKLLTWLAYLSAPFSIPDGLPVLPVQPEEPPLTLSLTLSMSPDMLIELFVVL